MSRPVAIFPWGDVIEEFLDPLGLSADDYARRMQGGWLFGYVAALQRCGVESFIVYASERVARPERLTHAETGASIWLVPGRRSDERLARKNPSHAAVASWARTPARSFTKILRDENCGAVLIQDYEHPRYDAVATLARSLGLPVFATFQGGDVTLSPLERRVRRRSLRLAERIFVASDRERRRLQHEHGLPADRIVDVPNPVNAESWRPLPREEARAAVGLDPETLTVVNHGRIDIDRKGLDVLLSAWKQVAAQRPDARLVIIGSGQDADRFAELAHAVPQLTWIPSYVTDPSLIRTWLSAADIYVTLSRIEGMPVAPLEACACQLPVVATDAHGLADIFADGEASGGLVARRGDEVAACQALLDLASDPLRRARLGAAARRNIERRYSLDAVGSMLAKAMAGATLPTGSTTSDLCMYRLAGSGQLRLAPSASLRRGGRDA